MKKIFSIFSAALVLFSVASCDLDREPVGQALQEPFKNYDEIGFYYDGIYQYLRSAENPTNYGLSDYLTNYYTSSDIDGGTWAPFFHWDKTRLLDNDMINGYYSAYSALTMQANYFIMRADEALKNGLLEKKDQQKRLQQMLDEAKVMKAVSIYRLMLRYQKGRYTKDNASEPNTGVCLSKEYNPTLLLPRASKKESYDYAIQLLDEALNDGLLSKNDFQGKTPDRITDDYAHAMKARIYLQMQEYTKAVEECDKFIDNYPLSSMSGTEAENIQQLIDINSGTSTENMVQLFANTRVGTFGQMPGWIGGTWVPSSSHKGEMFYRIYPLAFPSKETLEAFAHADDLRAKAWIGDWVAIQEGAPETPLVQKFFGNSAYETIPERPVHRCAINLCNIGEIYLIKAEALAMNNDLSQVSDVLAKFKAGRGGSQEPIADQAAAISQIKNERRCELIGEGMLLNDMQRWNEEFNSGTPNASNQIVNIFNNQVQVHIPAGDKLFSWEFPRNDRQSNKYLRGHGNWD